MNSSPKYFDPQTLAKLPNLTLRAQHVVEGYLAGSHRSPAHGFSIEFAEHREYVPGDDLRYVDWKVFGRTDKFYLKQFEDETNLVCHLVVDISESMRYQGPLSPWSKYDFAATMAASLAWLILQQQDAVGLCCFDESIRSWIRPKGDPAHLRQLITTLESAPSTPKTSIGRVLHDVAERIRRRGIVIIFSDLFDDVDDLIQGIRHLRHCRHDVIVAHTMDAAELDFPFRQQTLFHGLEAASELLVDPRNVRNAYRKRINEFRSSVEGRCRDLHVDYVLMRNDRPLNIALSEFLVRRITAGRRR